MRWGVLVPSAEGSKRVFQNTSLPEKKARLTPWLRAEVTFARWLADQYSSWPVDMNTLWLRSWAVPVSTSVPAT